MPLHFWPKNSARHRAACTSLYRGLLARSVKIKLPPQLLEPPGNHLRHLIRKLFQRKKHETSPKLIVEALKAGYETEALLTKAINGHEVSYCKIIQVLQLRKSEADRSRARVAAGPRPPPRSYPPKPYTLESIFERRPLSSEQLKGGIRNVPKLLSANGLPFLRISKPQSPFLSRVLNDKIIQRRKRRDHLDRLAEEEAWGKSEDLWTDTLRKQGVVPEDNASWMKEIWYSKVNVEEDIAHSDHDANRLAVRMLDLVDKEQELADQERKDRKRQKLKDKKKS